MSLATSPPVFARYTSNYAATPTSGPGTAAVVGANSTDGAAVTLVSALGHDVHKIRLRMGGTSATTVDGNAAGDLLIDPAGGTSWSVLINDLVSGFTNTANTGVPQFYDFPLYIPAGASVGWQCKTVHTADMAMAVTFEGWGEPSNPSMWWCGQGVETLGISDAKGTAITSGASGADGTWTSVGSVTTKLYKAIQVGLNGSDAGAAANAYHFQIGADSQVLPGAGIAHLVTTATEIGYHNAGGYVTCSIPIGTQIQVRGTCSGGSPETIYVAAYGVY